MTESLKFASSRWLNWANFRSMNLWSILEQSYLIPKPRWTPKQIPDQTGSVVLITGGNAGIGKECVKALLSRNATVYIACRTRQKSMDVIEELYNLTGNRAHYIELDLGDLASVQRAAEEFKSKESHLDILLNNAGIMFPPLNRHCGGYDAQIHTNVLGHFYLTKLLLPTMLSGSKAGRVPRVIHTSSMAQYAAKADPLDFSTFKCGPARDRQTTYDMYVQSKYANVLLSNELSRRYGDENLVSIAVNPGNIKTELGRDVTDSFVRFVLSLLQIYDAQEGAITPLWAATAKETMAYGGKFLVPWARLRAAHPATQNEELARELWNWLEDQIPSS